MNLLNSINHSKKIIRSYFKSIKAARKSARRSDKIWAVILSLLTVLSSSSVFLKSMIQEVSKNPKSVEGWVALILFIVGAGLVFFFVFYGLRVIESAKRSKPNEYAQTLKELEEEEMIKKALLDKSNLHSQLPISQNASLKKRL